MSLPVSRLGATPTRPKDFWFAMYLPMCRLGETHLVQLGCNDMLISSMVCVFIVGNSIVILRSEHFLFRCFYLYLHLEQRPLGPSISCLQCIYLCADLERHILPDLDVMICYFHLWVACPFVGSSIVLFSFC